ncbi:hypothetical protein [Luteolibacter soli]|uniref:Uncharacterized protein n=1 Tax=Luteolibacter soli TaxID=3135280 RepID=A0ABU9ASB2_9BACT
MEAQARLLELAKAFVNIPAENLEGWRANNAFVAKRCAGDPEIHDQFLALVGKSWRVGSLKNWT